MKDEAIDPRARLYLDPRDYQDQWMMYYENLPGLPNVLDLCEDEILFEMRLALVFRFGHVLCGGSVLSMRTYIIEVHLNDVFAWGCSDSECIGSEEELAQLYCEWKADRAWGPVKWACIKRMQRPQGPVEADMRKAGVWCERMESLPPNTQDAQVHALIALASRQQEKKGDTANPDSEAKTS